MLTQRMPRDWRRVMLLSWQHCAMIVVEEGRVFFLPLLQRQHSKVTVPRLNNRIGAEDKFSATGALRGRFLHTCRHGRVHSHCWTLPLLSSRIIPLEVHLDPRRELTSTAPPFVRWKKNIHSVRTQTFTWCDVCVVQRRERIGMKAASRSL